VKRYHRTVAALTTAPSSYRPAGPLDALTALRPYAGPWNRRLAAHLLRRAGFGGSPADVDRLAGACDGINVKLQKCGGISEGRAMIERAHQLGLKVMLGCRAAETSVAIAAAAHLAPAVEWADLDGNLLIVDDPFIAVPVERGRFVFSDRPGLGVLSRA